MSQRKGETRGQALRFLLVGGINTLISYSIFVVLGLFIEPWIAYSIGFAVGLIWTSIGSSRFVFRATFAWRKLATFVACYLIVWGVGQLVIRVISPTGVIELVFTSLVMLVVTTPLIFIIGRFVFARSSPPPSTTEVSL